MKKTLLISIGILILMVSCKETEAKKTEISEQKPTPKLKIEKENKTSESTHKTEIKNNNYNITSDVSFEHNGKSEIGKIDDKDGFSNLRKERNSKSEILSIIIDNEYFFYQPTKQSNWLKVKDLKGNIGFIHRSRISKVIDTDLYNVSFTDYNKKTEFQKDTIVSINFLEKFFLDNYSESGFNYRKLDPQNDSISHKDTLAIYKDIKTETSVSLSKSKFNPKEHKIEYQGNFASKIDNKEFWGTDGGIPRYKFENITILESGNSYSIPKSKLSDIFGPNLGPNYVHITKPNDDRLIIKMANSDGAGAYAVVFILKGKKLLKRIVYHNF